jgi:GWxTD domain-containing protein
MRRLPSVVLILALAFSAQAGLVKYKDWLDTPEATFLTAVERAEWRKLRTDDEAAAFIARYVARRGGMTFKAHVEHRTGIADKFFSTGEIKGSRTQRGRLVILLGAPKGIARGEPFDRRRVRRSSQPSPSALSGTGELGGSTFLMGGDRIQRQSVVVPMTRLVGLTFQDGYEVVFEVDDDGSERLARGTDRKKLDAAIEAAIAASIVKP